MLLTVISILVIYKQHYYEWLLCVFVFCWSYKMVFPKCYFFAENVVVRGLNTQKSKFVLTKRSHYMVHNILVLTIVLMYYNDKVL